MKSFTKNLAAAALLASAAFAGQAVAAPINFYGAEFDLALGAGAGDTWDVVFSADFTDFDQFHDGKESVFLTHINWKWSGFDVESVNSVAGPSGISYGDNLAGPHNCSGGFPSDFVCFDVDPDLSTDGVYSWTFNVTFSDILGGDDMDATGNPLRARFADRLGLFDDLMSCKAGSSYDRCTVVENPPEVPLPGTLGLLGLGLTALGLVRRRKA